MRNRIFVGAVTLCVSLPLAADPIDMIAVGGPVAGNSWAQNWQLIGIVPAWHDVFMVSADTFASPALTNYRTLANVPIGTFGLYAETPTSAFAGGSGLPDPWFFTIHFEGVVNNPGLTVDYFYYDAADTLLYSARTEWTGTTWKFLDEPADPGTTHPFIPLPTGAAMAMVGMGMIGIRRRR